MSTKSIDTIANEILLYQGKCPNVNINNISNTLFLLDEKLKRHEKSKQLKKSNKGDN